MPFRIFFKALLLISSLAFTAACEPKSSESYFVASSTDEQALSARVKLFETTFDNGEIGETVEFIPPAVVNAILKSGNISKAELKSQMDMMWDGLTTEVEVVGFSIDHNSNEIEILENGRSYKLMPTVTEMRLKANDSEVVTSSETLAFHEKGEWYFVRLDDVQQVAIFKSAYPDMADLEVMAPVTTIDGEEVKL